MTLNNVKFGMFKLTSGILEEIREGQKLDLSFFDRLVLINQGKGDDFMTDKNGVLCFCDMVCVPDMPGLKKSILEEGHKTSLSIHPDATKM